MRVLTVGTFDLLHPGHINFLRNCQKISGVMSWEQGLDHNLTVAVNTDEFVQKFKGKAPIQTYDERKEMVYSVRYVYNVIKNAEGEDLKPLLDRVKPNALVVGSDWAKKDYYTQTQISQEFLDRKGILLIYIPYTEGISTTLLKERILNSE